MHAMSKVINIYGHIAVFVITVNLGNIFNKLYPTLQRITTKSLSFKLFYCLRCANNGIKYCLQDC